MANKIQIKRTTVAGKVPLASQLDIGELAVNTADGKLFTKHSDGAVKQISGGGGSAGVFVGTTAPALEQGALWFKSDEGVLKLGYQDGDSSQWIDPFAYTSPVGSPTAAASVYDNEYALLGTTTSATEAELFIGGAAGARIPIPLDKVVSYSVEILAKGASAYATFELKGVAKNVAGTVSDVGNLYEVVIVRTDAAINVDARVVTADDSIGIYVTGLAGTTLNWKAAVRTLEL